MFSTNKCKVCDYRPRAPIRRIYHASNKAQASGVITCIGPFHVPEGRLTINSDDHIFFCKICKLSYFCIILKKKVRPTNCVSFRLLQMCVHLRSLYSCKFSICMTKMCTNLQRKPSKTVISHISLFTWYEVKGKEDLHLRVLFCFFLFLVFPGRQPLNGGLISVTHPHAYSFKARTVDRGFINWNTGTLLRFRVFLTTFVLFLPQEVLRDFMV